MAIRAGRGGFALRTIDRFTSGHEIRTRFDFGKSGVGSRCRSPLSAAAADERHELRSSGLGAIGWRQLWMAGVASGVEEEQRVGQVLAEQRVKPAALVPGGRDKSHTAGAQAARARARHSRRALVGHRWAVLQSAQCHLRCGQNRTKPLSPAQVARRHRTRGCAERVRVEQLVG